MEDYYTLDIDYPIPSDLTRFFYSAMRANPVTRGLTDKWKLVVNFNDSGFGMCHFTYNLISIPKTILENGTYFNPANKWLLLHEIGHARQWEVGAYTPGGAGKWQGFDTNGWNNFVGMNHHYYASMPWELDASTFAFTHPLCEEVRDVDLFNIDPWFDKSFRAHRDIRHDNGFPMKLEKKRKNPKEFPLEWYIRVSERYGDMATTPDKVKLERENRKQNVIDNKRRIEESARKGARISVPWMVPG